MSEPRREFIVFVGPKGSGKSSLMKALVPNLNVKFEEARYYRDYKVDDNLYFREVGGKMDAIDIVRLTFPRWNVKALVVVADSSRPDTVSEAYGIVTALGITGNIAFVLNKADLGAEEARQLAVEVSSRLRATLFEVSCKDGAGIGKLRSWLGLEEIAVISERAAEARGGRIVPIPLPDIPREEGELRKYLDEKKIKVDDTDITLLLLVDGEHTVDEIAETMSLKKFDTLVRLKRLASLGLIKELAITI